MKAETQADRLKELMRRHFEDAQASISPPHDKEQKSDKPDKPKKKKRQKELQRQTDA